MAENVAITAGSGTIIGTDEVTINAVAQQIQRVKLVDGTDGGTGLIPGDAANGLDVDVTRLPALVAGTATIGTVKAQGISVTGTSGNIAAAGTGTVGPLDVSAAGNVTFVAKNQTAGTAFLGAPVLVFEQSDDNTSWAPMLVTRGDNLQTGSTHTLPANVANAEFVFDAAAEAITYVRCRCTTGPTTNPMTIAIGAGGMPFSPSISAALNPITGFAAGLNATTVANTTANVRVTGTGTATTTALVAAPAAGLSIYVTDIVVGNSGSTLTVIGLLPLGGTNVFDLPCAASGGGATINLSTPWKLAPATGLNYVVSAATTSWFITVIYYIAG